MSNEMATLEHEYQPVAAASPSMPEITLEKAHGLNVINLRELWEYRELLYFLSWRDVKVRYKQAALGVAWAVIRPFLTALLFFFIVNGLRGQAKLGAGVSDPHTFGFLHIFAGMVLWDLFAGALNRGATSLVSNANLLTKVYFPRLMIPLAAVVSGLLDFAISLVILAGMLALFRVVPGSALLMLPVFSLLALLVTFGAVLWLGALNVRYRDVGHIIPFLVQVWMLASPVVYPVETIIHSYTPFIWRVVYFANPMVEIVVGFRWTLLGGPPPDPLRLACSIGITLVMLLTGLWYFKQTERSFADIV